MLNCTVRKKKERLFSSQAPAFPFFCCVFAFGIASKAAFGQTGLRRRWKIQMVQAVSPQTSFGYAGILGLNASNNPATNNAPSKLGKTNPETIATPRFRPNQPPTFIANAVNNRPAIRFDGSK